MLIMEDEEEDSDGRECVADIYVHMYEVTCVNKGERVPRHGRNRPDLPTVRTYC
jgi:hypothetical protein